jgi:hypothetical protein
VKLAFVVFAAIVTEEGTCAMVLLVLSATIAPPKGAGPVSATVAVDELPPRTALGLRVKVESVARLMVRVADRVAL